MKELIEIITLLLAIVILIGTLGWSLVSGAPMPFVIGYPIAAVILLLSWMINRRK